MPGHFISVWIFIPSVKQTVAIASHMNLVFYPFLTITHGASFMETVFFAASNDQQFKSQMIHFLSSSLLIQLEKQWKTAEVAVLMTPTWETSEVSGSQLKQYSVLVNVDI